MLVFENRGREVGATIDHPHGQIYGYPFVPPAAADEVSGRDGCAICRELDRGAARQGTDRRRTRRLGGVGAVRVGLRVRPAVRAEAARRVVAGARRHPPRRPRRAAHRRARPLRPALARAASRLPLPVPALVPPGARRVAATTGTCTRTSPRRCARPACCATSRRASSAAARSPTPCSPRMPREHCAMPETTRRFRAPGSRQPDRRTGRLPRGLGGLDGDRPRRARRGLAARLIARVTARSADADGIVEIAADGSDDPRAITPSWGRAVGGVARVLAELGRAPVGADLDITSSVPIGGGLSSSAAFEVAVALALADVAGFELPPLDLALAAQRSEHAATGVPCGTQDQLSSVFGRQGHALLIDCRTLDIEPLPLPDSIRVLVVHSGVPRTLEGSPYAQRRAESIEVGRRLGLRGAPRRHDRAGCRRATRGRHAVSEMLRVRDVRRRATRGRRRPAGRAHAREPRVVAHRHGGLDSRARRARRMPRRRGRAGARLTGAGFGGCIVALVPTAGAAAISDAATSSYRARTGLEPTPWIVAAADGAGPSSS